MRFGALLPAVVLLLTGCAADVTFAIDVHRNGSATATTREIMDDHLYRLALRQTVTGDPFGIETMQHEGWSISQTADANGNHVITMSKLLRREDLSSAGGPAPALRGVFLPLSAAQISRSHGFFSEQDSLSATAPALLPFVQSQLRPPYDDLASAMLSAAVALHFELRTPGKIVETNGERTPSGFVRWNLGLQAPTKITYTVRLIRYDRIALILLTAFIALIVILAAARRRGASVLRSH
jgi:hypothetical protein